MPPSNRTPVELKLGDVELTCRPLPFEKAADKLAEVGAFVSRLTSSLTLTLGDDGLRKLLSLTDGAPTGIDILPALLPLLPTIQTLFDQLGAGKLREYEAALLYSSVAVAPDENGVKQKHELATLADRVSLFELYPESYIPTLFFAGAVTYKRFFPGSALFAFAQRSKAKSGIS